MWGTRRSVESTGVPSEREGMDTFPPTLPRAQSWGVSRWRTSRDPRRSFDASREGMDLRRMSASMREPEMDVQRRDMSLDVAMFGEGMGDSQEDAQTQDSRISGSGGIDPSTLSTAATRGKKWKRGLRKSQKKFWQNLKASLGFGGSSSGSGATRCRRCGKTHQGVCLAGTTVCFRCRQEGHMARECPNALRSAQSQRAASGGATQPAAQTMFQASGRGRGRGAASSSAGSLRGGPSAPARIFVQAQQKADTSNTVVSGTLTLMF